MTNNKYPNPIQAQNLEVGDVIEDKAGIEHTIERLIDLPHSGRTRIYDTEGRILNARHQEIFFLAE
jgi:hypothetical protein